MARMTKEEIAYYARKKTARREANQVEQRAREFIAAYGNLCRAHGFELAGVDDYGYHAPSVLALGQWNATLHHEPEDPAFTFDGFEWEGEPDSDPESPPMNKDYSDYRVRELGLRPLAGFDWPNGYGPLKAQTRRKGSK